MGEYKNKGKEHIFVIMPFKEPLNKYYEEIISPAVDELDFVPKRADDVLGAGIFMEDVINGIVTSRLIIAELTGRNANVFYERPNTVRTQFFTE
jgi:hypothetical protein